MIKYIHGGDIYSLAEQGIKEEDILDFSANINPLGMPEKVRKAAVKALEQCSCYPDPLCRKLRQAVAEKEQVPEEFLIFGNGAADLIFRLAAAVKPKKALVPIPSFAEYEEALTAVGCRTEHFYLQEDKDFVVDDTFCRVLTEEVQMIFLCNPNNPTGQLIQPELLKKILQRCKEKKILAVVDECFIDFVENPKKTGIKDLIFGNNELFVLRAFTKNYAMPGIRLGYGICGNTKLLEKLSRAGQPWSVSRIAQEAGIAALKEDAYLEKSRQLVFRERQLLQEGLSRLGYRVFPPGANYIFFKLEKRKDPLYHKNLGKDLRKEGILIRDCSNYAGLEEGYFRIAVRTGAENERLLAALERREQLWQSV